ncbi:conserved Plasmodium protein, unknown function [Plasmodium chabaudi adami]|uniref:RNA polymerase sigma-70 region 3 domain-containing protein n=1 Tax=Plasmodium chabaudi adami TaxID=5826 RepID=A0A1D3RY21_PLACE|nr:conserved Plasmodium protein, unknown function [Plasmodium chabaudi adami]
MIKINFKFLCFFFTTLKRAYYKKASINTRRKRGTQRIAFSPICYYSLFIFVILYFLQIKKVHAYGVGNTLNWNGGRTKFSRSRRKNEIKNVFSKFGDKAYLTKCENNMKKQCYAIGKERKSNEIESKTVTNIKSKSNIYFKSLCNNDVLNKNVDENVNFNDGVENFFVLNPNPNILFLINNNPQLGKIHSEYMGASKEVGKSKKKKKNVVDENKDIEAEKNDESKGEGKKKIRLRLKRGYLNDVYKIEKQKLNKILLSFNDKSIFNKKHTNVKENILLLNGQTVKTEVVKEYLFHKLRLEYYENIRDKKKILTLDLWSKEINIPIDKLKKLIIYIYKMKSLVQKEDEDLLIKTYFYNKKNMFSLFRNTYNSNGEANSEPFNFKISGEDDNAEQIEQKEIDVEKKDSEENYDIFTDYFENHDAILYKDCEKLINEQVQKFMEYIKDIVFFENSIYILEKLENRPPLLEELIYGYNYEKDDFLRKLENKIRLSQKLLIYFIPLISNIVRKSEMKLGNSNLSEDDFLLVSLDAVKNGFKKYDVEKLGLKNLTKYVYMWAKNSTYNYYQKHKSFVSISAHTYNDYNKINKFEESFFEKHDRKPNIKEISEGLNMSIERIEKAMASMVNIIDAEKPITYQNSDSAHPEKNTYKDLIVNADDIYSFNEIMYNDIVIKALRKFISKSLKKKISKLIIFMKFGLFLKKKNYSDEEICQILKISKKKFDKYFQDSIIQIKNFIKKIKYNKNNNDPSSDLTTYLNFSQYDFMGNEFSQIEM